jgi:hypothetical protein
LAAVAGRVRHPSLTLVSFAAELSDVSDDEDHPEEVVADDLSAVEQEATRLRRAAVLLAALNVVDRCIDDLQVLGFDEDGLPDDDDEAAESFVYEWFPPRQREAYKVSIQACLWVFSRLRCVTACGRISGLTGDGRHPGVSGESVAQGGEDAGAVLGGGGDVAADGVPVAG